LAKVTLPIDEESQLLRYDQSDISRRDVAQVSLGCHVNRAALPHVDPGDSLTVLDGIKKRIAIKMPEMRPDIEGMFTKYVDDWLKKNLTPLPPSSDVSIDTWLNNTHYPAYRKEELKLKHGKIYNWKDPKYRVVKSFIKDETYVDFKHARTINSRTDEFKTLVGPIFKLIEKELFSRVEFIKKIPVDMRPRHLLERFYNKYRFLFNTDFSSFEAHFVKLMENCEMKLYRYMTKNLPDHKKFMFLVETAMLGMNKLIFKNITVLIKRRRMSGEMSLPLATVSRI